MQDKFHYIIREEDEGFTIKELLRHRLGISSRLMRKMKNDGCVYLDGGKIKFYEKGRSGQRISLQLPEESSGFIPESIPIEVLYEDPYLLAVNKQPGIVVHPTKGHPCHTIANGIMKYMADKAESFKIRFINRLDMDTTGVLLIGKNSYCQDDFARQAEEGMVTKNYAAVVKGIIEQDGGIIDLPVGKPEEGQLRRAVIPEGSPSVTRYKVLERFSKGYTFLELTLETGRTHQIRVHLSHIGHPVAGDVLYGGEAEGLIDRQALHATRLIFHHPVTKQKLFLEAGLPDDMIKLLEQLK